MQFRCSQEYVVGILVAVGTWILLHAFRATDFLLLGYLEVRCFRRNEDIVACTITKDCSSRCVPVLVIVATVF